MLIDMDITIAYKCFSCGTFDFTDINLFKLFRSRNLVSKCKCKAASFKINGIGRNKFELTVPCIGCGIEHTHVICKDSLISNDINVYSCPVTGIRQCFVGKDEVVREYIDRLEKEMDSMIDGLGYDNYFENTQVMLDTLNKIHDIAEKGHLSCGCGCDKIDVSMLRRGILLRCSLCSRSKFIPAASNTDLKKTLSREKIILIEKKAKPNYQIEV